LELPKQRLEIAMRAKELVEQFKAEATRTGAIVYEAKDVTDASNYVLKLAQEHNVRHIVKSKSMLIDEIGLRERLENAGIEVKETDIGDWIAQLAGERPVHMAEPPTHKTIEQVAELFSKATGENLEPEPQVLLDAAHRYLRQSIINADMGISGANIAIAETGTLITISNEGNDRLVATLPPIHVTMLKSKDLVPTMEDATAKLKEFNKKMPDGKMPSYVTYISGKNTTADIPSALMARAQGPDEEHIVLVDKAVSK
jgi:L-lactate dehydrogenase complex protein LldF